MGYLFFVSPILSGFTFCFESMSDVHEKCVDLNLRLQLLHEMARVTIK